MATDELKYPVDYFEKMYHRYLAVECFPRELFIELFNHYKTVLKLLENAESTIIEYNEKCTCDECENWRENFNELLKSHGKSRVESSLRFVEIETLKNTLENENKKGIAMNNKIVDLMFENKQLYKKLQNCKCDETDSIVLDLTDRLEKLAYENEKQLKSLNDTMYHWKFNYDKLKDDYTELEVKVKKYEKAWDMIRIVPQNYNGDYITIKKPEINKFLENWYKNKDEKVVVNKCDKFCDDCQKDKVFLVNADCKKYGKAKKDSNDKCDSCVFAYADVSRFGDDVLRSNKNECPFNNSNCLYCDNSKCTILTNEALSDIKQFCSCKMFEHKGAYINDK